MQNLLRISNFYAIAKSLVSIDKPKWLKSDIIRITSDSEADFASLNKSNIKTITVCACSLYKNLCIPYHSTDIAVMHTSICYAHA